MSKDIEVRVGGLEKKTDGHEALLKEHSKTLVEHATELLLLKSSVDANTQANKDLLESHKKSNDLLAELVGGMKALKWIVPIILTIVATMAAFL